MKLSNILFIIAFVFGIIYYNTWAIIKESYGVSIYHKSVAFEFLILFYAYTLTLKGRIETIFKAITSVVGAKFIDEMFFDPTVFEWVEVLVTIIGFLILVFKDKLKKLGLYVTGFKRRPREDKKDE